VNLEGQRASHTLRVTRERKRAEEWSVALSSQGIPSRVARDTEGWVLLVPDDDVARAVQVLDSYDLENAEPKPSRAQPIEYGSTQVGVILAGSLVVFFAFTGPRSSNIWFQGGSASAADILAGEFWRTVTALTLHADLAHVAANAAFGALFATLVCRSIGPGLGSWLILLSGCVGNALNAWVHGAAHDSVGASTAIFGAIGILGGIEALRRRIRATRRGRAWLPLAGALALLAMLGMGEHSDVSAHFLGFVAGGVLGLLAGLSLKRPPGPVLQWLFGATAAGAVLACWSLALG
jgi:membrane associated rhomboid family serine protease